MPIPCSQDDSVCCLNYGGNEYVAGPYQTTNYLYPNQYGPDNPWNNGGNVCSGENNHPYNGNLDQT